MGRPPTGQKRGKATRIQIVNPITKARISITADDPVTAYAVAHHVRSIGAQARFGQLPAAEADSRIRASLDGAVSLADVWQAHVATYAGSWARSARAYWTRWLAPHFGEKARAIDANRDACEAWETWCAKQGLAASTIRNIYNVLAAAYRRAVDGGKLASLPWGGWRPTNRGRGAVPRGHCDSAEELGRLLLAAQAHDRHLDGRGMLPDVTARIAFLFIMGRRQAEGCGVGWDDLAFGVRAEIGEDGMPRARPSAEFRLRHQAKSGWRTEHPEWTRPMDPPKGYARRAVKEAPWLEVQPTAVRILLAHRDALRARGLYRPDGPVFPTREGEWRSDDALIKPELVRKLAEAAGLPEPARFVAHSGRHTTATLEARASKDVRLVQQRLGHMSLQTSMGYMRAPRDLRSTIGEIAPGLLPDVSIDQQEQLPPLERATRAAAELERAQENAAPRLTGAQRSIATEADFGGILERWANDPRRAALEARAEGRGKAARPPEVNELARAAYNAAYIESMRKGESKDVARKRGIARRTALFGAWGLFCKRIGVARKTPDEVLEEPARDGRSRRRKSA